MGTGTESSTGEEMIMWNRFPKGTQAAFKGVLEDLSVTTFDRSPVETEKYIRKVKDAIGFVSESGDYLTLNNRQVADECIKLASRIADENRDEELVAELYYLGDIARALIRPVRPGKVNR